MHSLTKNSYLYMHHPVLATIKIQSQMHVHIKHSLAHPQDLIPTLADVFCIHILYQPKLGLHPVDVLENA